jgi:hypothetical protein
MEEYDIDCCVCDGMPNVNDAKTFGKKFKKRVFLVQYQNSRTVCRWSDDKSAGEQEIREEAIFEFNVLLDRYQSIEESLYTIVRRRVEWPDPNSLVQQAKAKNGRLAFLPIAREFFYPHMKGVIRCKVGPPESSRMVWLNLSSDPHFLHAWNYCNMGLNRMKNSFFWDFI